MCPMASLFNLIEDPCKSMWNSSVKLDLFSSAIFKVHFLLHKFWIILDYCLVCVFCFNHVKGYFQTSKEEKEKESCFSSEGYYNLSK